MATKFTANSIDDLVKFLRDQAEKANAASSVLARNKSGRHYYDGRQAAYNELAFMLEEGELEITSVAKLVRRIQDSVAIDMPANSTLADVGSLAPYFESQPTEDELILRERAEARHAKELEDATLELNSQDKATRTSELKGLFAKYGCSNLWQPRFSGDSILRILEQIPKGPDWATLRSVLRRRHTDVLRRLQGIQGAGAQRPVSSSFANGIVFKEGNANAK